VYVCIWNLFVGLPFALSDLFYPFLFISFPDFSVSTKAQVTAVK